MPGLLSRWAPGVEWWGHMPDWLCKYCSFRVWKAFHERVRRGGGLECRVWSATCRWPGRLRGLLSPLDVCLLESMTGRCHITIINDSFTTFRPCTKNTHGFCCRLFLYQSVSRIVIVYFSRMEIGWSTVAVLEDAKMERATDFLLSWDYM